MAWERRDTPPRCRGVQPGTTISGASLSGAGAGDGGGRRPADPVSDQQDGDDRHSEANRDDGKPGVKAFRQLERPADDMMRHIHRRAPTRSRIRLLGASTMK